MFCKSDGAGEGDHEGADGRFGKVMEAKVAAFDWIMSKEVREV
jgi:hypothetical protein